MSDPKVNLPGSVKESDECEDYQRAQGAADEKLIFRLSDVHVALFHVKRVYAEDQEEVCGCE